MDTNGNSKNTPVVRFSIDDIQDKRRPWAVREHLSEMMHVELDMLDLDAPFQYRSELHLLPRVAYGGAFSSAVATHRTRQLTKDGQDDLMLVMPETRMTIRMPNRDDVVIDPGDAVLVSQAREMTLVHHHAAPAWAVRTPYKFIAEKLPHLSAAPVLPLRKGTPMLALLLGYRRALEIEPLMHEAEQELASDQLLDLLSAAICRSPDYLREAEENSLPAVRMRIIKADILASLGNVHLNLEAFAARHSISPRQLQRLFSQEGTSFSDHLRRTRLARVRALLTDPRNASRTIASIALECGFAEASSMNRAFREEYGETPGDLRR